VERLHRVGGAGGDAAAGARLPPGHPRSPAAAALPQPPRTAPPLTIPPHPLPRAPARPPGGEGGDAGLLEALGYVNGRKAALEAELIARERAAKGLEAERNAARRELEELRAQLQVRRRRGPELLGLLGLGWGCWAG
jgi:hypothetical protein